MVSNKIADAYLVALCLILIFYCAATNEATINTGTTEAFDDLLFEVENDPDLDSSEEHKNDVIFIEGIRKGLKMGRAAKCSSSVRSAAEDEPVVSDRWSMGKIRKKIRRAVRKALRKERRKLMRGVSKIMRR